MFPLYCIVDTGLCAERRIDPLAFTDGLLRGGAKLIQLRDKQPSSAARLALADAVVARCRAAGAQVIVNDFADVAVMSGADGVHVGQDDLPVDVARAVVGADRIVGVSTHDAEQVAAAAGSSAVYVAVGPVYDTRTKDTGYAARGLQFVRTAAARTAAAGKPLVAIGGITLARAPDVLAAGARSVAVIGDLLTPPDPAARVAAYLEALRV